MVSRKIGARAGRVFHAVQPVEFLVFTLSSSTSPHVHDGSDYECNSGNRASDAQPDFGCRCETRVGRLLFLLLGIVGEAIKASRSTGTRDGTIGL